MTPMKTFPTRVTLFLHFILVGVTPFLTGCNQKEINELKTERDAFKSDREAVQTKLASVESERDKLRQALSSLQLDVGAMSNEFQMELTRITNGFQLERSGFSLTNSFLLGEVERLRADFRAQRDRSAAEEGRLAEAKKLEPIKEALRALRKLESAANIGTSLSEYNKILIESQVSVREAISASSGTISAALEQSLQAYQDAKTVWRYFNEVERSHPSFWERIHGDKSIVIVGDADVWKPISDYRVATETIPRDKRDRSYTPEGVLVSKSGAVSTIWGVAKKNSEKAEELFAAESAK